MKKITTFVLMAFLAITMVFASAAPEKKAETITLKISLSDVSTDIRGELVRQMAAEVEEKTKGELKFEIHYGNELGAMADVNEQIILGANILTSPSGDFLADFGAHDILASNLMYVLPTIEDVEKLNDSALFKKWCDQIEAASGLKVIAMSWCSSPRNIISTKPINSVADLKGLKVRVPGLGADSFFSALGSSTMTMAFSDVYSSMQQGMIDAAEAALSGLYSYSLHEVGKYVYMSEHSMAPGAFIMNAKIWNQITPESQAILKAAIEKYGRMYYDECIKGQAEVIKKMEAAGVKFVYPSDADKKVMQAAGLGSFKAFPELSPDLADQISAVLK